MNSYIIFDLFSKTKEMDTTQTSSCESDLKQVLKSEECEQKMFRNNSHLVGILEGLQSLRKNEVLCDIKFKTDDGCIVFAHKNVLMAASPYFDAMFSNYFNESNSDFVSIKKIDSTILQPLLDYIYTGEIMVTKENVQVLLPAARFLQLDFVNDACAKFLQNQLDVSNCFSIREFADLHNCTELISSSEAFIKKQFSDVVKYDEFLFLSFEDFVKIISYNDIAVKFEEKVFESVMKWVKHDLDCRKDFLPHLMKHVRLPLINLDVLSSISEEPLLNNNTKCKEYVFEAICFNLQITIPKTIRCKSRTFGCSQKVILMFNFSKIIRKGTTEWYDPTTKIRKNGPDIEYNWCHSARIALIRDQFVFALIGTYQTVSMLNVSSQSACWVRMANMIVKRRHFGVGVLENCIYAVGGNLGLSSLNSVEVFDISRQNWRIVSNMSNARSCMGVGVLNNRLYAVGGADTIRVLNYVECYDPSFDEWTPVSEMSERRYNPGVGVLEGVLYAIGGYNGSVVVKSAEIYRPNDGVWSFISDMHYPRWNSVVVVLNGLLYVIGGESEEELLVHTVEMYNPHTNTWTIVDSLSSRQLYIFGGVAINRPSHVIIDH